MENEITLSYCISTRNVNNIVALTNKLSSTILITKGDRTVNAASILGLLSLCIMSGDRLKISAINNDKQVAIGDLRKYIQNIKSI